jgi:Fe-S cluster assembly protein SufD
VHQIHTKQKADSRYHAYVIDTGGKTIRNNHATYLQGENTETHLLGNYIATGSQSIDNQTFIDHALPNCYSNELYKGIAAERGKGVFNGKILVHQDAQKTNAFQQNASLVLSPHAVIDAKPQLEIFADDVKCSHGATIGQLDEESVFYLRSRGLSDSAARRMLQKAFVDEVADHIEFEKVQEFAHTLIDEKLSTLSE